MIINSLQVVGERSRQVINDKIRGATLGVFSSCIMMTPVGNPTLWKNPERAPAGYVGGNARNNWHVTIDAPFQGESDNGGSSQLNNIPRDVLGKQVFLTNNVPYIHRLEYDAHSTQAPNGMARVSVARFEGLLS